MDNTRQLVIQDRPFKGKSVVYIMSRDQRTDDNHALLAAQACAQTNGVPLYVLFVLKKLSTRSREHYEFMLSGLEDVSTSLSTYSIPFTIRCGRSVQHIYKFAEETEAGALFFDFSPLKGARAVVKQVARQFDGSVVVVDTHNIIPAWIASDKQEFAAHTMRTKVHRLLQTYLVSPSKLTSQQLPAAIPKSSTKEEIDKLVSSVSPLGISFAWPAGQTAAVEHLDNFIRHDLATYARGRNDIAHDQQSNLSPYLHFGHISSLRVALDVMDHVGEPPLLLSQSKLAQSSDEVSSNYDGMNALFEEMIVRKELSDNFCLYSKDYRSFTSIQDWAAATLDTHASDPREFIYTCEQWEASETHDDAWNAAQTELARTGKMHGYMRMYWAKKLLEWSATPEEALRTALYLNDKYSIDGGDPNGYVGILWSIASVHDRPWTERPVFGKVRYMNRAGLQRKFDLAAYIQRVSS